MHTHRFTIPLAHRLIDSLIKRDGRKSWHLRPGVTITPLVTVGNRVKLALLDYEPGAHVPRHRHPRAEIIYMLRGEQRDDCNTYGAGRFVINRSGSDHEVNSPNGCRLMIYWREPVKFIGDPT
jgi:anti-sigma factor ChrR (cupin superfamily)